MSVYGTSLTFGPDEDDHPAPLVYRGSHILPRNTDPRGGVLHLGAIPGHITRDGRDDGDELRAWPWLRVSIAEVNATDDSTVLLDRAQVQALRDELTQWLDNVKEAD